MLENCL